MISGVEILHYNIARDPPKLRSNDNTRRRRNVILYYLFIYYNNNIVYNSANYITVGRVCRDSMELPKSSSRVLLDIIIQYVQPTFTT